VLTTGDGGVTQGGVTQDTTPLGWMWSPAKGGTCLVITTGDGGVTQGATLLGWMSSHAKRVCNWVLVCVTYNIICVCMYVCVYVCVWFYCWEQRVLHCQPDLARSYACSKEYCGGHPYPWKWDCAPANCYPAPANRYTAPANRFTALYSIQRIVSRFVTIDPLAGIFG